MRLAAQRLEELPHFQRRHEVGPRRKYLGVPPRRHDAPLFPPLHRARKLVPQGARHRVDAAETLDQIGRLRLHTRKYTQAAYEVNVENVAKRVIDAAMPIAPEDVPETLRRLCRRAGLGQAALARAMGYKTTSGLQRKFETPPKAKYLSPDWVARLANILAGRGEPPIAREEVLELAGNLRVVGGTEAPDFRNLTLAGQNISPYGIRDLPILGQARSGDGSYIFENGTPALSYTYRPVELLNSRDAYAVYVHGDSMAPRFKHGELVYVDPHRPVTPGDDVVVQLNDGHGYIKELVRRTARTVLCRQHNPDGEIEFPAGDIKSIHLILLATRVRV